MADQPVDVPVGALTLVGKTPQRARKLDLEGYVPGLNTTITIPTGTLTLTSYEPVAVGVVFPTTATVVLTGIIPTANNSGSTIRAPPTGILTLTGQAPQRARKLTLTGYVPGVLDSSDQEVTQPAAGSLTLAGSVPTRPVGLKLQGYVPTLSEYTISPGVDVLALAGYAPGVSSGTEGSAEPGTKACVLFGHVPALEIFVANADASLELTGYIPTFSFDSLVNKTPGTGSLNLAGLVPTLDFALSVKIPPVRNITLTGFVPIVDITHVAHPDIGSLTLTGQNITFTFGFGWTVPVVTSVRTLTGLAPEIGVGPRKEPATDLLALTGQIPTVTYDWVVEVPVGTLNLTGFNSFLGTFGNTVALKELNLTTHTPTVIYQNPEVFPAPASLTLTPRGLIVGPVENPNAGALSLTGSAPTLVFSENLFITVELGRLEISEQAPETIGWFLDGALTDTWSKDSTGSTTWIKTDPIGDKEWQS